MTGPLIFGKFRSEGHVETWPIYENGQSRDALKVTYGKTDPVSCWRPIFSSGNMSYVLMPPHSHLQILDQTLSIPFVDGGQVKDVRKINVGPMRIENGEGYSVAKIHRHRRFSIDSTDIERAFYVFEILQVPERSQGPGEHFDLVYADEKKTLARIERGDRVVPFPGGVLYPDYCAFRLPGWLCKEFNGSPELGVAYSRFLGPRKGEVLHAHTELVEPYIVLEGEMPFFIETENGTERYVARKTVEGQVIETEKRGERLVLTRGDFIVPSPHTAHRILTDSARYPFTQVTLNYSPGFNLTKIPSDDRTIFEDA